MNTARFTNLKLQPRSELDPPTVQLLNRLDDLYSTPPEHRWPLAVWPNDKAYKEARKCIKCIPLDRIPTPEIYFADDGEINFLWKTQDIEIDLGFFDTGNFSYFARSAHGEKIYEDDAKFMNRFPDEILALIAS